MRAFVSYVLRGRLQAISVAAACAVLSLLLPPLGYVSGAVVGLATLRHGVQEGALVVAGSGLLSGALVLLVTGSLYPVIIILALTWVPVWILAAVLRATANQGAALAAAGLLAAASVGVVHLLIADPAAWWKQLLERFIGDALQQSPALGAAGSEQFIDIIDRVAPLMTGLFFATTLVGSMLVLFLARWWHALVDNPGGFGREFRSLALDRRMAPVALLVVLVAVVANRATDGLAAEFLWIIIVMYLFQGLAVVHSIVASRGASVGWLVALYLLLIVLPPQMVLPLAITGFTDVWMDLRGRVRRRGG